MSESHDSGAKLFRTLLKTCKIRKMQPSGLTAVCGNRSNIIYLDLKLFFKKLSGTSIGPIGSYYIKI
jgi:hypothetical protein